MRGPRLAFGQAFLLSGGQRFVSPLRRQIANLYAARKVENGRILLPNKYGDNGWYGYTPDQHFDVQKDIYLWIHSAIHLDPKDSRLDFECLRHYMLPKVHAGFITRYERCRQDRTCGLTPLETARDIPDLEVVRRFLAIFGNGHHKGLGKTFG